MSTFQILLVILVFVYVITYIYFAITGRILSNKDRKTEAEYAAAQFQWEDQVKVLTTRIGEISSENHRLNGVIREWMTACDNYKIENEKLKKELKQFKTETE